MHRRWWHRVLAMVSFSLAAVAATFVAVAVNVATGGSSPWLPSVEAHPLWSTLMATAAAAGSMLLVWWSQRRADRVLDALVPAEQRPEPWVVDRPAEVGLVVAALCRRAGGTVGITTAVQGAGGFGKTTVAKLVSADRRVLRRFGGRVYWVTLGRDIRTSAAIAEKVNDLISRVDPSSAATFTDPQQAGEHLAALMAAGPRRLLVLDDVWHPEQEAAFQVAGRSARLVTTRIPSLVAGRSVPVQVDEVTPRQAEALLTAGIPSVPRPLVQGLIAVTWHWALLLRLVNKVLVEQTKTGSDATLVAEELLRRLRHAGALHIDELTGVAEHDLEAGDPRQRQRAVTPTIEASMGMLTAGERCRFVELAIFAEDETVPVGLIGKLWRATGELDLLAARRLCARLGDLALLTLTDDDGGVVVVHDVVRDFLREEVGGLRLAELNRILLTVVASDLPTAEIRGAGTASRGTAWWQLGESARYLWDHLIEHLIGAGQHDDAEGVATDLRWVAARLDRSGPTAPHADLAVVGTPECARLQRLLGQTGHLLGATDPPHSRVDVLCSRVAHDQHWGPQVDALRTTRGVARLTNRWPLPDLPHPALRRTLTGPVVTMTVAPDGSWLATGGDDGSIRIWDVATGTQRTKMAGHTGRRRAHSGAARGVYMMAVAPDGSWLASAGDDGTIRVWDVATGTQRAAFPVRAFVLAAGPSGDWLAAAGRGGVIRIWDVATNAQRHKVRGPGEDFFSLQISPDGSWLACATPLNSTMIWDLRSGVRLVRRVRSDTRLESVLAFAPDSTWLATGGPYFNEISIWNVATGKRRTLRGDTGGEEGTTVGPDGTWIASCSKTGRVTIWDTAGGEPLQCFDGHAKGIQAVAVAPDGTWLGSCGDDRRTRIWDVKSGAQRADLPGHPNGKQSAIAGPDCTWLATAGSDRMVRIWDVGTATRQVRTAERFVGHVFMLAAGSDGTWLATAGSDRMVRIWDVATGAQRTRLTGHVDGVAAMAAGPGPGSLVTADGAGTVRIWHIGSRVELLSFENRVSSVVAVAVQLSGSWLAVGRRNGTVRLWQMTTGARRTACAGPPGTAEAVAISPDCCWLAAAGVDGTVRIFETTTAAHLATLQGPADMVVAVAIGPDGSWLATGGRGGIVQLWDVDTGAERATFDSRGAAVVALAVQPDNALLAVANEDGTMWILDPRSCKTLAMMRTNQRATTCAWTANGRSVVVGGPSGLCVFEFLPEAA